MEEAQLNACPIVVTEAERHSASQRRVNLMWEFTQSSIAISIVFANITAAFVLTTDQGLLLGNAFFLIVGFYFGRTNHARVGGVQLGR